jgi:hypothetical protein
MNMKHSYRIATRRVIDDVEMGLYTWEQVARAALSYMSEDDVADMAHNNGFFEEEEEEDEEE